MENLFFCQNKKIKKINYRIYPDLKSVHQQTYHKLSFGGHWHKPLQALPAMVNNARCKYNKGYIEGRLQLSSLTTLISLFGLGYANEIQFDSTNLMACLQVKETLIA